MHCTSCGAEVPHGSKFCGECGSALPRANRDSRYGTTFDRRVLNGLAFAAPDLAQEVLLERDLGVVHPVPLGRPVDVAGRHLGLGNECDAAVAEVGEAHRVNRAVSLGPAPERPRPVSREWPTHRRAPRQALPMMRHQCDIATDAPSLVRPAGRLARFVTAAACRSRRRHPTGSSAARAH